MLAFKICRDAPPTARHTGWSQQLASARPPSCPLDVQSLRPPSCSAGPPGGSRHQRLASLVTVASVSRHDTPVVSDTADESPTGVGSRAGSPVSGPRAPGQPVSGSRTRAGGQPESTLQSSGSWSFRGRVSWSRSAISALCSFRRLSCRTETEGGGDASGGQTGDIDIERRRQRVTRSVGRVHTMRPDTKADPGQSTRRGDSYTGRQYTDIL